MCLCVCVCSDVSPTVASKSRLGLCSDGALGGWDPVVRPPCRVPARGLGRRVASPGRLPARVPGRRVVCGVKCAYSVHYRDWLKHWHLTVYRYDSVECAIQYIVAAFDQGKIIADGTWHSAVKSGVMIFTAGIKCSYDSPYQRNSTELLEMSSPCAHSDLS